LKQTINHHHSHNITQSNHICLLFELIESQQIPLNSIFLTIQLDNTPTTVFGWLSISSGTALLF